MCEIFNHHFINIVNEYSSNTQIPKSIQYNIIEPFNLQPTDCIEIEQIIMSLNSSSSNGYDNISARFLKEHIKTFAEPIRKHVNEYMENGNFPDEMKIGCVISNYK